jgi:hypothetical protein
MWGATYITLSMKTKAWSVAFLLVLFCPRAESQGTLVYDQQSSTDELTIAGNDVIQQLASPYGQSFTPATNLVGFIRLKVGDRFAGNSLGATLFVNLRTGTIGGPVASSTDPVLLPDGFFGTVNFFFATPVPVTPGTTYFFQPVVQAGDSWIVDGGAFNYPGGTAWVGGSSIPGSDYWFREGFVVPEPSSCLLMLVGCAMVWILRRGMHPNVLLRRESRD